MSANEQDTDQQEKARWTRLREHWQIAVLAVLLALSAIVASWLYVDQFRPLSSAELQSRDAVLKAADDGTVALLTYAPESLDADLATAKDSLTGAFLDYYTRFTESVVVPSATRKKVATTATVVRSGIVEISSHHAVVLALINQSTTSAEHPESVRTSSNVKVALDKIDGRWLISSFDPV